LEWLKSFAIPYLVSTFAASLASKLGKHLGSELSATLIEWVAENGGYYLATWVGDKFTPPEKKVFKESHESLKQLLAVEGLDTVVRLALLWLGSRLFKNQELGVALASTVADISFALTLKQSHHLLETISRTTKFIQEHYSSFHNSPALIGLGLTTC
jgi:hypothetical protein